MEKLTQLLLFIVGLAVASAVTRPIERNQISILGGGGGSPSSSQKTLVRRAANAVGPGQIGTLGGVLSDSSSRSQKTLVRRAANAISRPIDSKLITTLHSGISRTASAGSAPIKKRRAAPEKFIATLRQSQDVQPDGSYTWEYETENGINAQEQGSVKTVGSEAVVAAAGNFAWTSPENEKIEISYIADENGYQPQGSHLPVAPPIPEAILKAIAWNEAHPEPDQAIKRIR